MLCETIFGDGQIYGALKQVILISYVLFCCKIHNLWLPHSKAGDHGWLAVRPVWPSVLYPSVFLPSSIWLCGSETKSEAQTIHVNECN